MKTIGTLFSGFGGVDIGAQNAGIQPIWGIEYDQKIADVARTNLGHHIHTADILDCDPRQYDAPDILHASPPCPNFSIAKQNGKETDHDIALANRVLKFATVLRPNIFTLENVISYRKSKSWAIIRDGLMDAGYWISIENVNAADYGVPQSRKRMIVRAVLNGWVPYLPEAEAEQIGWHEAIADLVEDFPPSQLAPWQLKKLPKELSSPAYVPDGNPARLALIGATLTGANRHIINHRFGDRPSMTITTTNGPKLKLISGHYVRSVTIRAIARLQSFPNWYKLPKSKTFAGHGLGNAVPPLLYQKLIQNLLA